METPSEEKRAKESPSEEQRSEGDSERSVTERRRLHALYRAYGNEGAGGLQDCPRPNSAAVFCYSSAWVLQGNLAPRGRGGGQRAVRPITPRSFSGGAWADGRERGGGWGVRSFPMVLQSNRYLGTNGS